MIPLGGSSSFALALTASGFNGQKFAFHGYLSRDARILKRVLFRIETEAQKNITQIFMETPYRNTHLLNTMLHVLKAETHLCIATNLGGPAPNIKTMDARAWGRASTSYLEKNPAVFFVWLPR